MYKMNMYWAFSSIILQIYLAYTLDYNQVDESNLISQIAAIIWTTSSIAFVIIFCLSLIHKPIYKLLLIFYQISWFAFVLSGVYEVRLMRYLIIMFSPLLYFSTLKFAFIITIFSNLGILIALRRANELDENRGVFLAMIIQPLFLIKYDITVTQNVWNKVRLDHNLYELQKVLNNSSQCILIYSRETKKLLF